MWSSGFWDLPSQFKEPVKKKKKVSLHNLDFKYSDISDEPLLFKFLQTLRYNSNFLPFLKSNKKKPVDHKK